MRRLLDEPVFFDNGRYCYRVPSRQPLDAAANEPFGIVRCKTNRGWAAVGASAAGKRGTDVTPKEY
jgi:hypothetical protein